MSTHGSQYSADRGQSALKTRSDQSRYWIAENMFDRCRLGPVCAARSQQSPLRTCPVSTRCVRLPGPPAVFVSTDFVSTEMAPL